jgi:hypothetical protein
MLLDMIYKCTRIRWIVAFTVILGDKYKLCQYFLYVSTWVDPWYFSRVRVARHFSFLFCGVCSDCLLFVFCV